MKINQTYIDSPLGKMIVFATQKGICLLEFTDRKNIEGQIKKFKLSLNAQIEEGTNKHIALLEYELKAYFEKQLKQFTVPLDITGTDFQQEVWQSLRAIPYGTTSSYLKQAKSINKTSAVRAVANANGMNKIAIIIPCHRVIGSNGMLTGYAGGLYRKKYLLELERDVTEKTLFQ